MGRGAGRPIVTEADAPRKSTNDSHGNGKNGECNATEAKDKTLCYGKIKRSELFLIDTSYCSYDAAKYDYVFCDISRAGA